MNVNDPSGPLDTTAHSARWTRRLGVTGLTVSRLGLGLAALGRPAYIDIGRTEDLGTDRSVATFERRSHQMLDVAYDLGIRYVDAARSYGLAESFLANWLSQRQMPVGAVTVGSKWGYSFVGGWRVDAPVHERKDLSASHLKKQVVESRAILGDWLQLYQVHSATLESGVLDDCEVLAELARLRAAGLAIGVTVTGPRQRDVVRRVLGLRIDGVQLFEVVQASWNLLEPSAGAALAEAHAAGLGVIVKEALANGRLTSRAKAVPEPLRGFAQSRQVTVDALAIAAATSQPWADVVLSGAVTPQQLRANVDSFQRITDVSELPNVAQVPAEYWSQRTALAWQ